MSKIKGVRVGSGKERSVPKGQASRREKPVKSRKQKTESHGKSTMNSSADIRKHATLFGRKVY